MEFLWKRSEPIVFGTTVVNRTLHRANFVRSKGKFGGRFRGGVQETNSTLAELGLVANEFPTGFFMVCNGNIGPPMVCYYNAVTIIIRAVTMILGHFQHSDGMFL